MITLTLQVLILCFVLICIYQLGTLIVMIKNNDYDEDKDPNTHGKIYLGDKEITSKQAMNIIIEDSKK